MRSFVLSNYTTRNVGTFCIMEAQTRRGEIVEEEEAQEICYNAMEVVKGSTEKILKVIHDLKKFPLSTEAWGIC